MKKICLVGPVDKRAISYPLLKVAMFLGKTLVVTDDATYRRFAEDYEMRFGFENSEFIVTALIDEAVLNEVESIKNQFDFIIFITTNEVITDTNKIIYLHGVDKGIANNSSIKVLENTEHIEVVVTFSKVEDATLLKIEPSKNIMSYIYECEDRKEFVATKDVAYATMLEKFFDKELDIPKATIKGLLQRKG